MVLDTPALSESYSSDKARACRNAASVSPTRGGSLSISRGLLAIKMYFALKIVVRYIECVFDMLYISKTVKPLCQTPEPEVPP